MAKQNYIYLDIEKEILADIYKGRYQYGDRLPSENELAVSFNVARMTTHKALKDLEAKGYIYAIKGSGYYLNQLVNSEHATLKSFTENARISNAKLTSKLLVYKQVKAITDEERTIAKKLLCSANETFHYFERLRLSDDRITCYEKAWVPISRIPKLDINCLNGSFYSYIENELKLNIKDGNSTIEVQMSNDELNKYFDYTQSTPLFRVEEITNLNNGLPFEFNISFFRIEDTKFEIYRERKK